MKQNDKVEGKSAPKPTPVQRRTPGASSPSHSRYGGTKASVQGRGMGGDQSDAAVQAAADDGIRSPSAELPYLDKIQGSFGRHDVTGVKAHVGGKATAASQKMGAMAYAKGDHVAFGGTPDLFTAAHEAAHVVQQRSGVSLRGGVGQAGDAHEQHADAVAEKVVRGESAEALLDQKAGSGGSAPAVQRRSLPPPPQNVDWGQPVTVEITASALRVRSEPNTSSSDSIIGRFPRGTRVQALGKEGDWLKVDYQGKPGFMHGGYVKPVNPPTANDQGAGAKSPASSTSNTPPSTTTSAPPKSSSSEGGNQGQSQSQSQGQTAGPSSTSGQPSGSDLASMVLGGAHALYAWIQSLSPVSSEGDDKKEDNASDKGSNQSATPKTVPTGNGSATTTPDTTPGATPVDAGKGDMAVPASLNRPMTVIDSNALIRDASGKQPSGAGAIPKGTRVRVIAAKKNYVQIVTVGAGEYVATAADNVWTALGNLASGGADVGLGNERTDENAKKAAAGITASLPEDRNIGGSPATIQFKGHFSTSRDGYSLSSSLFEKVMRMLQWAIHNDMVTGDIHISDGIRSPKTAHRISVAWHIQHDPSYNALSRVSKLPGGRDPDGTKWYQNGWGLSEVKANAASIRSSTAIAAEGYNYNDPKRTPNPVPNSGGLKSMGQSRHCTGRAIDVTIPWRKKGATATKNVTDVWGWEEIYNQFGLYRPLPKGHKYAECWHIEETSTSLDPDTPPVSDPNEP